jgi:transcriptional regulator with XRE-family HTH domain
MSDKIEIDLEQLFDLAKIGLTEEQIAGSLGVSVSTIQRRKRDDDAFAQTLKQGKLAGIATVTNSLFEQATGDKPSTSATIFFLKNRAGWADKHEVDAMHSGVVGLDLQVESAIQALREAGIDPASL